MSEIEQEVRRMLQRRADDITATNTVLSTQLAHLTIEKDHSGYLKDAADKGLFTQVLDFLFPW